MSSTYIKSSLIKLVSAVSFNVLYGGYIDSLVRLAGGCEDAFMLLQRIAGITARNRALAPRIGGRVFRNTWCILFYIDTIFF